MPTHLQQTITVYQAKQWNDVLKWKQTILKKRIITSNHTCKIGLFLIINSKYRAWVRLNIGLKLNKNLYWTIPVIIVYILS